MRLLLIFGITEFLLFLTPGPAVLLVISQAVKSGFRSSLKGARRQPRRQSHRSDSLNQSRKQRRAARNVADDYVLVFSMCACAINSQAIEHRRA